MTKPKLALITLYGFEALGIRALHAYLKEKGCDISVLFFKDRAMNEMMPLSDGEIDLLVDKAIEVGADVVGISLFSAMYPDMAKLTQRLRERAPEVLVVWGGYHPTVAPEECIGATDVLCIGEGEEPLWELVQRVERGEPYHDIPNLWVRTADGVVKNPLRPLIQDLDALPFFDYQDEGKAYYDEGAWHEGEPFMQATGRGFYFRTHYLIQTSRGCPYGCAYCSNSVFREVYRGCGSYVRQRSVDNIMKQLVEAREIFPELKEIFFFDEVLVLRKEWLREFARRYGEQIGLPFQCNLHPNSIDDEVIGLLVHAGLDELMVGIESGSERVRREVYNRPISKEKMIEMAEVIHRGGLAPSYNLLVDNPYETREDMDEAFEYLIQISRPYNLRLFSLTHLPNTTLTRRLLADGLIQPEDVEGHSRKSLERWRASLGSASFGAEALHWSAVLSLLSKRLIPKPLIRWMYRSEYLRAHPGPVAALARVANVAKKGFGALGWLFQGKINLEYIRNQWRSSIRVAR